jgi:hypothetical protein
LPKPILKTTRFYKNLSNTSTINSVRFQLKIKSWNPSTSINTEALIVNVPGDSNSISFFANSKTSPRSSNRSWRDVTASSKFQQLSALLTASLEGWFQTQINFWIY